MSLSVSTGWFRRTRGQSPPVLTVGAAESAPLERLRDELECVDRSVQTDARAEPARPGGRRGRVGALEQVAARAEAEVEVAVLEAELRLELLHPPLELHERLAEALDLLVGQAPLLHPPERLPLHELPQELDEGQDKLRESLLDPLGIGVDPPGERVAEGLQLRRREPEVARRAEQLVELVGHVSAAVAKLYGGHGPVHTNVRSGCARSSSATSTRKRSTSPVSTR